MKTTILAILLCFTVSMVFAEEPGSTFFVYFDDTPIDTPVIRYTYTSPASNEIIFIVDGNEVKLSSLLKVLRAIDPKIFDKCVERARE